MVSISSDNIQTIAQHEVKQKLAVVEEVSGNGGRGGGRGVGG